jgi:hypothetical protein
VRRIALVSVLMGLVVASCSSSAEPQPGVFEGSGSDGFVIAITVDDDLTMPQLDVTFGCGGITRQQTITFDPPQDLSDGSFDLDFSVLQLSGSFGGDGSEVSGSWSSGSCSGSWDAELSG